jgi:predicted MPP superfamily phosphohydrolase
MKFIQKIFKFIFILFIIAILLFAYAFFVEPFRITTNKYIINDTNGNNSLRVVQITDLHITERYNISQLIKIVEVVQEQNPDIIVFTGDLYDDYIQYQADEEVILALSSLYAPYGKYAVWGNHDYGGGAQRAYERIMNESGFNLLTNQSTIVEFNNSKIKISGLDDALLGKPNTSFLETNDSYEYHILLSHEPDIIDNIDLDSIQLVLSGHSHGGQVYIPGFARQTTSLAEKYVAGFYDVNDGKTRLYVSTGLGTTTIPIRFLVPPQIAVFDIFL